jgi:exonuclease VII small subunit
MAASQSILEIIIQAVDEASQELSNVANGLDATGQNALSAQEQLRTYGEAMETAGAELAVTGGAITAFYGTIVDSAAKVQESSDSLKVSVEDIVDAANQGAESNGAYSTQVAFLTDKINGLKATIAEATASLDTHTGSVEKSAAAHEKAAATIATAQANIQKYQQQLDLLTASQDLVGASADDIVTKFENEARANTDLGFSIDVSEASMKNLFAATKSVPDALAAYQTAMDLARAKQEDLGTATQQVIMAMQGQGRALIGVGITIKDGLSGMQALSAIQGVVGGQAQAYSQTLAGQMTIALQNINKLFSDMGQTQLPMLTSLFEIINKIIVAVDNWVTAHPKLTEIILVFIGVLGVMLTILGTIIAVAGAVALALAGGLSAAFIGIASAVAVGVAAIVALGVAMVANWNYIKDNMQAAWQIIAATSTTLWTTIKNTVSNALTWISNLVMGTLSSIQNAWNTVWTAVSTFFTNIWEGIKGAAEAAIDYIMSKVQGFINWASAVLGPILGAINAVGSAVSAFGHGIASAVGVAANVIGVHDAIITPSGQVIQSDPADYLFATKNPGNLAGGRGGSVNVFIQGGNYLDQSGARMIGDALAKTIVQQIKLRNYAS